jgi:hypothetical protein
MGAPTSTFGAPVTFGAPGVQPAFGAPFTFGAPGVQPTFGAPIPFGAPGVQPYPSVTSSAAPLAAFAPAPMPVSYFAAPPPQPVFTTVMETQVPGFCLET